MRAHEHVDRVDLDQADAVEHAAGRAAAVAPAGAGEALGGERDAPRLGGGDAGARHARIMPGVAVGGRSAGHVDYCTLSRPHIPSPQWLVKEQTKK